MVSSGPGVRRLVKQRTDRRVIRASNTFLPNAVIKPLYYEHKSDIREQTRTR